MEGLKKTNASLLSIFQRTDIPPAPNALTKFIQERFSEPIVYEGAEQRQRPRHTVMQPVTVVAIDKTMEPIGEPFQAITRNFSTQSIAFLHTRAVTDDLVALRFDLTENKPAIFVAHLERSAPVGRFYDNVVILDARLLDLEERLAAGSNPPAESE